MSSTRTRQPTGSPVPEPGGRQLYLLGHGIGYSASPRIHRAALRAAGLDWSYELLDVAQPELGRAIAGLRRPVVRGANVTIPFKAAAAALLDELDPDSQRAGAVNTIVSEGGRLSGLNTDVEALRLALESLGASRALNAVILGGGGAARAALVALPPGSRVSLVVRSRDRAPAGVPSLEWHDPSWRAACAQADVVINATPLGRDGASPLRIQDLPRSAVIDLVYVEGETALIAQARAHGLRCVDGWAVLVDQAAAAFRAWTGQEPSLDEMRRAAAR